MFRPNASNIKFVTKVTQEEEKIQMVDEILWIAVCRLESVRLVLHLFSGR